MNLKKRSKKVLKEIKNVKNPRVGFLNTSRIILGLLGIKVRSLHKNNSLSINDYKNLKRTLIVTVIVCLAVSATVYIVQTYGNSDLKINCSYLDPITMDFFAFFAGLFLFIEGFARIFEHPDASLKRQFTRIIRISFGVGLLTLHIMQFIHK
mgnify:FL=1